MPEATREMTKHAAVAAMRDMYDNKVTEYLVMGFSREDAQGLAEDYVTRCFQQKVRMV